MRRSRYTVTFADHPTEQILAYTPEGARDHYIARGHTPLRVRRVARRGGLPTGWEMDNAALDAVIEFFELRLPVFIRYTTGLTCGGTSRVRMGRHLAAAARPRARNGRVTDDGLYHHITLSRAWTVPDAGRAIWHELAHAMQAERAIQDFDDPFGAIRSINAINAAYAPIAYQQRPSEVEARSYEQHALEINPCVLAR